MPAHYLQEESREDDYPVGSKGEKKSGRAARREYRVAPEEIEIKDRILHAVLDDDERGS